MQLVTVCVMLDFVFVRLKSGQILTISTWDSNPCPTHQWLIAQSLNVRRRKSGTAIFQTVHFLQHDGADKVSLPKRDFSMANPNYFQ